MDNLSEYVRSNSLPEGCKKEKFKEFWENVVFNEKSIKIGAYTFVTFLYLLMIKYVFYDIGFAFSTIQIFLVIGQVILQIYFLERERFEEASSLFLFIFFDKDLIDIGNALPLLGVACIREELHKDKVMKEVVSFSCGLIFMLMGWSSVGRIFIIRFIIISLMIVLGSVLAALLVFIWEECCRSFRNHLLKLSSETKPEGTK